MVFVLRRWSCQAICKEQVAVAQQSPAAAIVPDVQLHFINIIGLPVNFLPPAEAVRVEIGLDLLEATHKYIRACCFPIAGQCKQTVATSHKKALAADACQCLVMLVLLIDLMIIISPGGLTKDLLAAVSKQHSRWVYCRSLPLKMSAVG